MTQRADYPKETLDRLLSAANDSRRIRSLNALNEACRLLYERHSSELSYKAIVTLGKDRGLRVPSEKSILNSTGLHYRELIHAWRSILPQPSASSKNIAVNWIDHIKDPAVRMAVSMLEGELRAMKAKESRKSNQSPAPIIIGDQTQVISPNLRLTDAELAALKSAIDPENLRLAGLSLGTRGEIIDARGRLIHKPGFRSAIEKLLSVQAG